MTTTAREPAGVDSQNPWPGLVPFTEEHREYFFGREKETEALFRLVKRETLTVLFGQSGLGKTSLLQAGLFYRLRQADFLPIYLRLDHSPDSPALASQARAALAETLRNQEIDAPSPGEGETLWEYFHRRDVDFWTAKNRLMTPVLVFDQFEEIFTLGRANDAVHARGLAFLTELADLVENRTPRALKEKLDREPEEGPSRFDYDRTGCKVVLSLREDYLPDFEGLRPLMRSIMNNRMRITRMTGAQALEVVERPGSELLDDGVAEAIVRFVASSGAGTDGDGSSPDRFAQLEVEPSLLSLVCRELNNKRLQQGMARITAMLLAGSRREILADFYERSMKDVGPGVRRFVEDQLLTKSAYRDSVALETALAEEGVTAESLDLLVGRRLLRLEERLGVQRVELTHDVLTEPVRLSRDCRQQREALAKAAAREAEVRRQLVRTRRRIAAAAAASVVIVVLLAGLALYWRRLSREAEKGLKYAKEQEAIAQKQRALAEESRYAADMRLAQEAADDGNIGRAMSLLRRYKPRKGEPDLRGFDWRYLRWVCQGDSLATYRGHTDEVRSVAFSPDGALLATGGGDSTLHLLNVAARKEIASFHPEGAGVMSVAFSPDGQTLACATGIWRTSAVAGKVYLWDVASLKIKGVLKGHKKSVNSVAFSPDGAFLATASEDDTVMLWTLGKEQTPVTFSGHSAGVNSVAFSPDSRLLAAGSGDGALQIWDVKTKHPITDAVVHISGIMSLAFAPEGQTLVLGSRDGPILFWDMRQGKVADTLDGEQGLVNAISFSPNGKQFATAGSNCTIKIWNFSDHSQATLLRGHQDMVFSVAFSPQGNLLASGGSDKTVKLWDPVRKREATTLEQEGAVSSIAFAPDGKLLATAGGESTSPAIERQSTIHLWDAATAHQTGVLSGHTDIIYSVAFSPDGKTLASGSRDRTVIVWDVVGRKKIMTLAGHTAPVLAVRFSPDGALLATGSRDGAVKLWDMARKRDAPLATLRGHQGWVRSVAFSPDGKLLVTASSDRTVRLWDVRTRNQIAVMGGYQGACNAAAFSPDGQLVAAASNDRTVRLWDVGAGSYAPEDAAILQGYNAAINSLAFSPNGKILAAGSQDSTVTLWSVGTKEEVAVFTPHRGGVLCVAFAPDGNVLATGSNDQTAKLWRAVSPEEAAILDDEHATWTRP